MKNIILIVAVIMFASCNRTDNTDNGKAATEEATRKPPRPGGGGSNTVPQVTGLTATAISPTQVSLTWNSVQGATTYWIYRNNYVPAIITGTNYTDGYLTSGTSYTYAIAAVVNSVLGPKSVAVTVTTP